jgi:hypothetical protein
MEIRLPIFVRKIFTEERNALEDSLRSSDAFVLRRCEILLATACGEIAPRIAQNLGCGSQTAIRAYIVGHLEGVADTMEDLEDGDDAIEEADE